MHPLKADENFVNNSQMTAVCALGYKQAAALRAADQAHTLPARKQWQT